MFSYTVNNKINKIKDGALFDKAILKDAWTSVLNYYNVALRKIYLLSDNYTSATVADNTIYLENLDNLDLILSNSSDALNYYSKMLYIIDNNLYYKCLRSAVTNENAISVGQYHFALNKYLDGYRLGYPYYYSSPNVPFISSNEYKGNLFYPKKENSVFNVGSIHKTGSLLILKEQIASMLWFFDDFGDELRWWQEKGGQKELACSYNSSSYGATITGTPTTILSNIPSNSDFPIYIQFIVATSKAQYFAASYQYHVEQFVINKGEEKYFDLSEPSIELFFTYSNLNNGSDTITVTNATGGTRYFYSWASGFERRNCSKNFIGKNTTVGKIASA